jgi:GAF domain-containing protein
VPLRWQQEIVGVLVATRDPGEPSFGDGDVEWLGGLADYAAIAVRNARSFEQLWQSPASASVDAQRIETVQQELEQLAIELQAAAERVQRLSSLLAGDDAAQTGLRTT